MKNLPSKRASRDSLAREHIFPQVHYPPRTTLIDPTTFLNRAHGISEIEVRKRPGSAESKSANVQRFGANLLACPRSAIRMFCFKDELARRQHEISHIHGRNCYDDSGCPGSTCRARAGEQQSSPLLADESRVSRRHVEWSQ